MRFCISTDSDVGTWYGGAVKAGPYAMSGALHYTVEVSAKAEEDSTVCLKHIDPLWRIKLTLTIQGTYVWTSIEHKYMAFKAVNMRLATRGEVAGWAVST